MTDSQKIVVTITDADGIIEEEIVVRQHNQPYRLTMTNKLRAAIDDALAKLHLNDCEACGEWFPEEVMVERDLDSLCPACVIKYDSPHMKTKGR